VLVTIDTLRADYVGCYGSTRAKTRTLDRIAKEGVRFETAIAPTPVTLPSHASLLTGLDPSLHGVHSNGKFELGGGIPTLAESFRTAGFATAAFVGAAVLDGRYGLARGFDVYDDEMGFRRTVPGSSSIAERRADEVLDQALAWVREAPDRFFLWVHLYDPHANYQPPRGFAKTSGEPPPDPRVLGFLRAAASALPPYYAGEIYYADSELGRLLRAVKDRWRDGRTLFVVTSDHGESLGEHGELTHSLGLYDATQRVPLLMAGPGVPPGRVVSAPVRLVDVAPTTLALAGLPPLTRASGEDLGPWLRGERKTPLDSYLETLVTNLDYGWSPVLGLRTQRYKYLRTTRAELYDLLEDPQETRNLAGERALVVAELDAQLEARLRDALPIRPRPLPSAEERALLESLGYLVAASSGPYPPLGKVGGPDPKDRKIALIQIMEARSDLAAGQLERARATLASAPEAGGWVAHARAEIALALGDAEDAERAARQMLAAQPGYPEGYLILGQALEDQGRAAEARAAYEQATRVDPTQSDSIVALGRLAESEADLEGAAARYQEALGTSAPSVEAALRLAAIRFDQGRSSEARAVLEGLGDVAHARPDVVIRLARAEARAGYRDAALARLERSARAAADPSALAEVYQELGGQDAAWRGTQPQRGRAR
jgi:arylsulfatase A-like enzyme/Tfp pilus assembly protein PilF